MRFLPWILGSITLFAACGGKTVLETSTGVGGASSSSGTGSSSHSSSGSSSSTTSSGMSSSTSTTSSSSGADCGTLINNLTAALQAAEKCNACMNNDTCMHADTLLDECGCPHALNPSNPPAVVQAAKDAEAAYQAAGCMVACEVACQSTGKNFHCAPGPNGGCDGTCTSN